MYGNFVDFVNQYAPTKLTTSKNVKVQTFFMLFQ